MNITLDTKTILIAAAILLVGIFIFAKACNNKPGISENQRQLDSLAHVQHVKDSTWRETVRLKDSVLSIQLNAKDSLSDIVTKQDKALEVSKAKVALLIAKGYASKGDTVTYLSSCDSLLVENIILLDNVSGYQNYTEELSKQNVLLTTQYGEIIKVKDSAYNSLSLFSGTLLQQLSAANSLNSKLSKKKRFGIGLQVGVTYISGKPQAYGGIGASYNLIRF